MSDDQPPPHDHAQPASPVLVIPPPEQPQNELDQDAEISDYTTDWEQNLNNHNPHHVQQLRLIAETGNVVDIDWADLQRALRNRLEQIIKTYQERAQQHEYDDNEFDLNISRDEIYELISTFSEPPFTIQRICELLYSPFKYYDRTSTFFRGLEKNLRVVSSSFEFGDQGFRIFPGT